jgi:hypothetical protein
MILEGMGARGAQWEMEAEVRQLREHHLKMSDNEEERNRRISLEQEIVS